LTLRPDVSGCVEHHRVIQDQLIESGNNHSFSFGVNCSSVMKTLIVDLSVVLSESLQIGQFSLQLGYLDSLDSSLENLEVDGKFWS